jgi:hypothetical protein
MEPRTERIIHALSFRKERRKTESPRTWSERVRRKQSGRASQTKKRKVGTWPKVIAREPASGRPPDRAAPFQG